MVPSAVSAERPAPGKRVIQTIDANDFGGDIHHTIYLPSDWSAEKVKQGKRWPVVLEYPGNKFPQSGCTGRVEDASLGYGIAGDEAIWVVLPFVDTENKTNALNWWGDPNASARYARRVTQQVCSKLGGHPQQVLLCGFSRGAIAVGYIGLRDEETSEWWSALLTHDHFDGERAWPGTSWGADLERYRQQSAIRLQRLRGRPMLVCQSGSTTAIQTWIESATAASERNIQYLSVPTKTLLGRFPEASRPPHSHTDRWLLVDSPQRDEVRRWWKQCLSRADDNPLPQDALQRLREIADAFANRTDVTAELRDFGKTSQGTTMRLLDVRGQNANATVVILGGIHSGECAGKAAVLQWLNRQSSTSSEWSLPNLRLLIVPTYNPDGDALRGIGNRPGQFGPAGPKGTRANGQGLDLNRDFMKMDAGETTALVRLMNDENVDALIDLHTTNGSVHRYDLTYERPLSPSTPKWITRYLVDELLPAVTASVKAEGYEMGYYGNYRLSDSVPRWGTYASQPRYSTNYAGVTNRIGILSEAYAYKSYRRRVAASRAFFVHCLDQMNRDADRIRTMRDTESARTSPVKNTVDDAIAMQTQLSASPRDLLVPTYNVPSALRSMRPSQIVRQNGLEKNETTRQHKGKFTATVAVSTEETYLIPKLQTNN
ncbi:MAG: M14 family zinc carboxypeptidase, partial [Planctomycetota bacterium]